MDTMNITSQTDADKLLNNQPSEEVVIKVDAIGKEQVRKAMQTLHKYKQGKQKLEDKIVKNEKWWKMRHWDLQMDESTYYDPKPASGWLFNLIISKHADYMDSFPKPNILPREEGDVMEARKLTSIIPVVLEQNEIEQVYSDEVWYKLKNGTGVYGIFWDPSKLNGLGDISIKSMDLLALYWEPGVVDIQKSKNLFSVELVDNEILANKYPELKGKLNAGSNSTLKKYMYDETIDTTNKSLVVDWYYKKNVNGKQVLHYCKFVDDNVLYATENDTEVPTKPQAMPITDENGQPMLDKNGQPLMQVQEVPTGESVATKGWYAHGMYPFVFDTLFKEEGMPVGFGFVDVGKNAQMSIDLLNNAYEKNALRVANPRIFVREDGGLNEEEYLDPAREIIHIDGNLGEDSIRVADVNLINSNYISLLQDKITELKETTGNRDATTGGTTSGVTAASAIAAMQESAGKTSRDQIKTTYRAYERVINMVIELIREFYDMPRQFRILGQNNQQEYVTYDNQNLQPQSLGNDYGVDMGMRLPVFDVEISAEKESPYSQLSQNELALQFYNSGFFNPQYCDQVLACMDMMEFQGKDQVMQKVQQNGGMYAQLQNLSQISMQMAQYIDQANAQMGQQTNLTEQVQMALQAGAQQQPQGQANVSQMTNNSGDENKIVSDARQQAQGATKPQ